MPTGEDEADRPDEEQGQLDEVTLPCSSQELQLLGSIANGSYFGATGELSDCSSQDIDHDSDTRPPPLPCAVPDEITPRPPSIKRASQRKKWRHEQDRSPQCGSPETIPSIFEDVDARAAAAAQSRLPAWWGTKRLSFKDEAPLAVELEAPPVVQVLPPPAVGSSPREQPREVAAAAAGTWVGLSGTYQVSPDIEVAARALAGTMTLTMGHTKSFVSEWFALEGSAAHRQLELDLEEERRANPLSFSGRGLFASGQFSGSPPSDSGSSSSGSSGERTPCGGVTSDGHESKAAFGSEACALLPRFIVLQVLVSFCVLLETEFAMVLPVGESVEHPLIAGFKLKNQQDCIDDRHEVWRWITYQALHDTPWHLIMNLAVLVIAGLPLERFCGSARLAFMFNVGVAGGALCYFVVDPHIAVVGMSAGCYALQAMHVAKLFMNWHIEEFRNEKVLFILVMTTAHVLHVQFTWNSQSSHATHFGGAVAGFIIGILFIRHHLEKKTAYRVKAIVFLIGCCLLSLCMWWWWVARPPKEIWESEGWCWARQVSNVTLFGDHRFRCVRCRDFDCIRRWGAQALLHSVSVRTCQEVGWAVTER